MLNSLNYASVDQSIEVFDGAVATQGLNKPKKLYVVKNSSAFFATYLLLCKSFQTNLNDAK